ncbi:hypothetical protein HO173_012101 [Letharia columbiana]|uniref:Uncharacterized protein n=1 Tax=Letharia columbiana TaxID=112416 RepID=A0A8H6FGV6_9LECA|nr:uncharacterized protein HO173_012101 [Letharia columbiana]KAF6227661.1 hypothetical protein HO173_012101 [Letharia columbiana]
MKFSRAPRGKFLRRIADPQLYRLLSRALKEEESPSPCLITSLLWVHSSQSSVSVISGGGNSQQIDLMLGSIARAPGGHEPMR